MIEAATSGRAKCKGCKKAIAQGELRFGDEVPGNFDGMMTFWYHLPCAVTSKPEQLKRVLARHKKPVIPNRAEIEAALGGATTAARGARIMRIERATSGRAKCQQCKVTIEKDTLRVVVRSEEVFGGKMFVHVACGSAWAGADIEAELVGAASSKPDKRTVKAIVGGAKLLDRDARGKELEAGARKATKNAAAEISVLSDWLEGNGCAIPGEEMTQLITVRKRVAGKRTRKK